MLRPDLNNNQKVKEDGSLFQARTLCCIYLTSQLQAKKPSQVLVRSLSQFYAFQICRHNSWRIVLFPPDSLRCSGGVLISSEAVSL